MDGIQSIYCKSYCTKCKIWLLNNFKTFNTDQHTASQSHQYFVRNGNLEQNKDNALSILTNSKKFLILYDLVEGESISTIENQRFTQINPNLPKR